MSKVISWALEVEFDDGRIEKIADMPNDVAQSVDDWLAEEVDTDD